MKLLLTGGAGYVGSACLRWLIKNGHDPIAFDNMTEGNREAVPADRLVVGDIEDREALVRAMKEREIEGVMHFAAVASVPDSISDPELYWRTNVVGTKNVLDAMNDTGVKRIVLSSTAATFSFDVQMPISEESAQIPEVPYGTTKLACETLIKDYAGAYDIGYAFLRYFNASGADPDGQFGEDRRHEAHLIPLILLAAVGRRDKVLLYGGDWDTRDGTCVRDYIHTDDLAQAHQLVIENLEPGVGLAYNLGTGEGTTILEVLRACEKAVGKPIPHEIVDRRPGDPGVLVASHEKIGRELGFKPRYPAIEQIVETAWRWHSSHPDGYPKEQNNGG